jgi:hypothetical protein
MAAETGSAKPKAASPDPARINAIRRLGVLFPRDMR